MLLQIVKIKLRENLAREKVGDTISSYLAFFDIINMLTYTEKIEIGKKQVVIEAWNYLYGEATSDAILETTQSISKKSYINNIENEKKKQEILMKNFNQKFKTIYLENDEVVNAKRVILNFMNKYRPILYNYLNKELIVELTIAPHNIQGDIAYLQ